MPEKLALLVQRRGDEILAAGIAAVALVQIWLLDESAATRVAASAGVVVLGLAAARRTRMPLALLGLLAVLAEAGEVLPKSATDIEAIGFFILLAVYSAAAHTSGRRTLVAGALTVVLYVATMATDPDGINVAAIIFFGLVFGGPWAAGRAIRQRRLREQKLEHEKAEAEATIVEERSRIARELHDIVAHSISVMVLQARGGRRVIDAEPGEGARCVRRDRADRTSRARGDASPARDAQGERRPTRACAAADVAAARHPARPGARSRAAGRGGRRRRARGVAAGRRPLRLPDRAGGADECTQARRAGARPCGRPLRGRRARAGDRRRRLRHRERRRLGPRPHRNARAGLGLRRRAAGGSAPRRRLRAESPAAARFGSAMTIRVLLADDQNLVRGGFRMILGAEPEVEVVGEAADGAEAVALARDLRPDVVLMDVRMPNVDGIEATRRIVDGAEESPRVLVLTTFDLDEYVYEALRAGASGFLLKDAPEEQLVAGIRIVAAGGS